MMGTRLYDAGGRHEKAGGPRDRRLPQREAANSRKRDVVRYRTEVIALRFCAQACSSSPSAVGRSLP